MAMTNKDKNAYSQWFWNMFLLRMGQAYMTGIIMHPVFMTEKDKSHDQ